MVHFLRSGRSTIDRIELRHLLALYASTFLSLHRFANLIAPSSTSVSKFRERRGSVHIVGINLSLLSTSLVAFLLLLALCSLALQSCLIGCHSLHLLSLESTTTLHHLVEVNLMTVELRAVHADKLGLAANTYTTSTTHTCAIHHDGIEADISRDLIFLSQQAAELHHDGRTDGKALIDLLALDDFFHTDSHHALLAVRTVVGHNDDLIT